MKFAVNCLLAVTLSMTIGAIPIGRNEGMTADADDAYVPAIESLGGIGRHLEGDSSSIKNLHSF